MGSRPLLRLSSADLNNLALEAADTPMHQAVLATVDSAGLVDGEGHVVVDAIRKHVEARLERVPELRRVLYCPPLFQGRPLWIDDLEFKIENHVLQTTLPAPGGEPAALAFAEQEMSRLLDRSRPLWQMWLLDGYARDRIGIFIKLHHALADGPAMVVMLAKLFDLEPMALEQPGGSFTTAQRPAAGALFLDSLRMKLALLTRFIGRLAHPRATVRAMAKVLTGLIETSRQARGTPRTSLNRPIGASRRIAALHLSLADVKGVAHRDGVKLNDVFLYLVGGGLRSVLAGRGHPIEGLSVHTSIAVSERRDGASMTGNHVGTVIVQMPVDIEDARERLAAVAAATARAKTIQQPEVSTDLMVVLARSGITRAFIRRQHMINVLTTNLPGPPVPLYFAGGRVRDPIALPPIAGNVTVSFAALSYAGGMTFSVVADAEAWPDLGICIDGMGASWRQIGGEVALELPARAAG